MLTVKLRGLSMSTCAYLQSLGFRDCAKANTSPLNCALSAFQENRACSSSSIGREGFEVGTFYLRGRG